MARVEFAEIPPAILVDELPAAYERMLSLDRRIDETDVWRVRVFGLRNEIRHRRTRAVPCGRAANEQRSTGPIERRVGDRIAAEGQVNDVRLLLAPLELLNIGKLTRNQAQFQAAVGNLDRLRKILPEILKRNSDVPIASPNADRRRCAQP